MQVRLKLKLFLLIHNFTTLVHSVPTLCNFVVIFSYCHGMSEPFLSIDQRWPDNNQRRNETILFIQLFKYVVSLLSYFRMLRHPLKSLSRHCLSEFFFPF